MICYLFAPGERYTITDLRRKLEELQVAGAMVAVGSSDKDCTELSTAGVSAAIAALVKAEASGRGSHPVDIVR